MFVLSFGWSNAMMAQQAAVIVNMAGLEGIEINQQNVFNYDLVNNTGKQLDVTIKGSIRYRNSSLNAFYVFTTSLIEGNNRFSKDKVNNAVWTFSDNGFRELFFDYNKMPQGTYEYCISIGLNKNNPEYQIGDPIQECVYQIVNDIFLINLVEPENNAKIYEYNPMLSWVVNYPFASQLTYRLRVAEARDGQNNENAINRNNPIYQDNQVFATSLTYPVTARPLVKYQPYVWTVDAYYKGILLGGAEAWRFTIIEDSLLREVSVDLAYYEFEEHIGDTRLNIAGEMKLKYRADGNTDTLFFKIVNDKGDEIKFNENVRPLSNGYNWLVLQFHEKLSLKHNNKYTLLIENVKGQSFKVPFTYLNPLFIK
ncbi:hypothetical protein CAP35_01290 [Chitinophagaceae bacterium IBVUCB1]|nr:hypothetical protein CAP35_01290 [Chitinophagaceae bacterium IBVUCB1]